MRRGTTSPIAITMSSIDLSLVAAIYVDMKQGNKYYQVQPDEITVDGSQIFFVLSEDVTASFDEGLVQIQIVGEYIDGRTFATDIQQKYMWDRLIGDVIPHIAAASSCEFTEEYKNDLLEACESRILPVTMSESTRSVTLKVPKDADGNRTGVAFQIVLVTFESAALQFRYKILESGSEETTTKQLSSGRYVYNAILTTEGFMVWDSSGSYLITDGDIMDETCEEVTISVTGDVIRMFAVTDLTR